MRNKTLNQKIATALEDSWFKIPAVPYILNSLGTFIANIRGTETWILFLKPHSHSPQYY